MKVGQNQILMWQMTMTCAGKLLMHGIRTCGGLWWTTTTGEALLRVKRVKQGQGMEAFRRLHQWFGQQTDMGLAELRLQVIRPAQAKREEDIARCIEEWNETLVELRRVDPDYRELPDAYQVAALREC